MPCSHGEPWSDFQKLHHGLSQGSAPSWGLLSAQGIRAQRFPPVPSQPLESLCMHRRDATRGATLLPVRGCREHTAALVSGTLLPCLGLLGKTRWFIPLQLLPGRSLAQGGTHRPQGAEPRLRAETFLFPTSLWYNKQEPSPIHQPTDNGFKRCWKGYESRCTHTHTGHCTRETKAVHLAQVAVTLFAPVALVGSPTRDVSHNCGDAALRGGQWARCGRAWGSQGSFPA